MKKSVTWLVGLLLAGIASAQTSVTSPNIVGFIKVDVPGTNKITMMAVPFSIDNGNGFYTLDEVLGTNFTAHWSSTIADQVWMWNTAGNKYEQAFLNDDGWGDPTVDWKWCYTGADGFPYPCAQTNIFNVTPSKGFFVNNKNRDRTLYLTGQVPTGAVTSVGLAGLQLVAYPYPVPQTMGTMIGTNDGAKAFWSSTVSDEIWLWNTSRHVYEQYFLNDDGWGDPAVDWKWCGTDVNGFPFAATNTLLPGMSFFYKAKGAGFNWNVTRPYPLN
jgi:hypothetical protein